jgi:hypothetical protein
MQCMTVGTTSNHHHPDWDNTFETNHPEWESGTLVISRLHDYAPCRLVTLVDDYTWEVMIADSGIYYNVPEAHLLGVPPEFA